MVSGARGWAAAAWVVAVTVRIAAFALVWWAVSEGDPAMAGYGLVVVPLAAVASLALIRPRPGAWTGIGARAGAAVVLTGWFLWRSVRGAIDVARRALTTPPDVAPEVIVYRFRAEAPATRAVIALLLTLMPGSLAMGVEGDGLRVHVLHPELDVPAQIARLEELVMRLLEPA